MQLCFIYTFFNHTSMDAGLFSISEQNYAVCFIVRSCLRYSAYNIITASNRMLLTSMFCDCHFFCNYIFVFDNLHVWSYCVLK